jgi:hypothetical protein
VIGRDGIHDDVKAREWQALSAGPRVAKGAMIVATLTAYAPGEPWCTAGHSSPLAAPDFRCSGQQRRLQLGGALEVGGLLPVVNEDQAHIVLMGGSLGIRGRQRHDHILDPPAPHLVRQGRYGVGHRNPGALTPDRTGTGKTRIGPRASSEPTGQDSKSHPCLPVRQGLVPSRRRTGPTSMRRF